MSHIFVFLRTKSKPQEGVAGAMPEGSQGKSNPAPPGVLHIVNHGVISPLGHQEARVISALLGNQFVFTIRILRKTLTRNELWLQAVLSNVHFAICNSG